MEELIFIIKESDEGGFEAKALGYSIFTEAEDMVSLRKAIKDAVICHFDKGNVPKVIRLHMVKDELMSV
ncbi:MAG: 2-oxoisovalerate dehydrogenase [Actinomycetota bacterium]|nr:2-oxoisovalerate dehydrogenase [Actinomycetota bacterium]